MLTVLRMSLSRKLTNAANFSARYPVIIQDFYGKSSGGRLPLSHSLSLLLYSPSGGYSLIWSLRVCASGKVMVF